MREEEIHIELGQLEASTYRKMKTLVICLQDKSLEGWNTGDEAARRQIIETCKKVAQINGRFFLEIYLEEPTGEDSAPLMKLCLAPDDASSMEFGLTKEDIHLLVGLMSLCPRTPWIGGYHEGGAEVIIAGQDEDERVVMWDGLRTLESLIEDPPEKIGQDERRMAVAQFTAHARNCIPRMLQKIMGSLQAVHEFHSLMESTLDKHDDNEQLRAFGTNVLSFCETLMRQLGPDNANRGEEQGDG